MGTKLISHFSFAGVGIEVVTDMEDDITTQRNNIRTHTAAVVWMTDYIDQSNKQASQMVEEYKQSHQQSSTQIQQSPIEVVS